MPHRLLIFSQSDYFIKVVDTNSHSNWQIVQIQISWLLHYLQKKGISGFSRTRVNTANTMTEMILREIKWQLKIFRLLFRNEGSILKGKKLFPYLANSFLLKLTPCLKMIGVQESHHWVTKIVYLANKRRKLYQIYLVPLTIFMIHKAK